MILTPLDILRMREPELLHGMMLVELQDWVLQVVHVAADGNHVFVRVWVVTFYGMIGLEWDVLILLITKLLQQEQQEQQEQQQDQDLWETMKILD
jgi:hypothetical protein